MNRNFRHSFLSFVSILVALGMLLSLTPVVTIAADYPEITQLEDLGDWLHYNGLIFGDMTSYTADAEGAIAVGGESVKWGIQGGYDAGGSYDFQNSVQLGQYTNPNNYPTVLLGAKEIQVGRTDSTGGHFNVHGGPIVMTPQLYAVHDAGQNKLKANDSKTAFYRATQELIDTWFAQQYRAVTRATAQYLTANDVQITYAEYSGRSFISDGPEKFVNKTLRYNGQVDTSILSITVHTDSTINSMVLPVDATWTQKYDLVIYNFPDAVNVTMNGDPQVLYNGLSYNKTWPDSHIGTAAAAERGAIASNTIYNFPAARQINMSTVFLLGSLMAPDANVSASGGSINGQLICNNFTTQNSMELHSLRLTRKAYDVVEDEADLGSFELTKYAYYKMESTVALSGAQFELDSYDEELKAYSLYRDNLVTGADGTLLVEDLPLGRYKLREVKAPPGFQIGYMGSTGEMIFEVTQAHITEALRTTIYNEPLTTSLNFLKVAEGNHSETLSGAQFQLIRLPDKYDFGTELGLTINATSGSDGLVVFEGLPMGSYTLKELAAPSGFERMENLSFDIVYDEETNSLKTVLSGGGAFTATAAGPYPLENAKGIPDNILYFFKYDGAAAVEDAKGLQGAQFHLYRQDGGIWTQVVDGSNPLVLTTDETGYAMLENVPVGVYRLVEITSPTGYGGANGETGKGEPSSFAAEFEVNDRELEVIINVPNTALRTDLNLYKVGRIASNGDTAHYSVGNGPVSGARFSLSQVDAAGDLLQSYGTGTTGNDGTLTFSGLIQGRYRLTETAAPSGYKILGEDILFQVDFDESDGSVEIVPEGDVDDFVSWDGKTLVLTVVNEAFTGSLTLYKMDQDLFQSGTDYDPNHTFIITYLEGAEFQLQRRENGSSGSYVDFGSRFTSTFGDYGTDAYGNQLAGAFIDGLPFGDYRVIETAYPAGYKQTMQNDIVASFSITKDMAEAETHVELNVLNGKDSPRGGIRIRKVDRKNPDRGLGGVEFKLWLIDDPKGILSGREHLEDVMPHLMTLGQQKYATNKPLTTDDDGWLSLDLEPGLYVLFEYEPADGYLYTLERGQTLERATDPSFYDYTYLFRVVSMPDPADGVRIQWVDRYKIQDGEVIRFDVDSHDVDNSHWKPDGFSEDDYRTFTITNRKVSDVVADVKLLKTGGEKEGLPGAEFTLYRADLKEVENGIDPVYSDSDFAMVNTFTSGVGGWLWLEDLAEGFYRLTETEAPAGYHKSGEVLTFSLVVNGYSKMLDFYDGDGNLVEGYDEPAILPDGASSKHPVFLTEFDLGVLDNEAIDGPLGGITLHKVDGDTGESLGGAVFSLYIRDGDGWKELGTGRTTDRDGLLTLEGLEPGSYRLVETAPPDGYPDETREFLFTLLVEENEVIPDPSMGDWDGDGQLVVENTREEEKTDDPTGEIILHKVDGESGESLPGAVFSLYLEEDGGWKELRTGLTTGEDGLLRMANLLPGSYRLVETGAPAGYSGNGQEFFFILIQDGGEVFPDYATGEWSPTGQLVAENTKDESPRGEIILHKVDSETGESLPGAVFSLYLEGNEGFALVQSGLTTDGDGLLRLTELPPGSYRLDETGVPSGYQDIGLQIFFQMVEENGLVLPLAEGESWDGEGRLTARNTREEEERPDEPTGEIEIVKRDAEDGSNLSGAVFSLYRGGSETPLHTGLATGSNGSLVIEGLPVGDYELRETEAPEGYRLDGTPIAFRMVLEDDAVVPRLEENSIEALDFLLYRWVEPVVPEEDEVVTEVITEEETPETEEEAAESEEEAAESEDEAAGEAEEAQEEEEVDTSGEESGETEDQDTEVEDDESGGESGDSEEPGDSDSEETDSGSTLDGGEPDSGGSDESSDESGGVEERDNSDNGSSTGESDRGGSADSGGAEGFLAALLPRSWLGRILPGSGAIPLDDNPESVAEEGEWVQMYDGAYSLNREGIALIRDLPAGHYRLESRTDAGISPVEFVLTEETPLLELTVVDPGSLEEDILVVLNQREPEEPEEPKKPGKGRPGGGGGGGGGTPDVPDEVYYEHPGEPTPEPEPELPEEAPEEEPGDLENPSTGGDSHNPSTGMLATALPIAGGVALFTGLTYSNRRTLLWHLRRLFRKK